MNLDGPGRPAFEELAASLHVNSTGNAAHCFNDIPTASDLGYLLHKNPTRVQTENLSFGNATFFCPDVSLEKCTAALLLKVDPVGLVRGRGPSGESGPLEQYVNDRPNAANSFLSVALGRIFNLVVGVFDTTRGGKRPRRVWKPVRDKELSWMGLMMGTPVARASAVDTLQTHISKSRDVGHPG